MAPEQEPKQAQENEAFEAPLTKEEQASIDATRTKDGLNYWRKGDLKYARENLNESGYFDLPENNGKREKLDEAILQHDKKVQQGLTEEDSSDVDNKERWRQAGESHGRAARKKMEEEGGK